jgi:hypothetical protein
MKNKKLNFVKIIKRFFVVCCFAFIYSSATFAVSIEKTAQTAALAKEQALNSARRTEFASVLTPRVGASLAATLSQEIPMAELIGLVDSVVIENEKSAATAYSADILIGFDKTAINEWLRAQGMDDFAANTLDANRARVFFESIGGLGGLAAIMRASRDTGADLKITSIGPSGIFANVRGDSYESFVSAVRVAGVVVPY